MVAFEDVRFSRDRVSQEELRFHVIPRAVDAKEVDVAATKMTQSESRVRYLEHLGKIEEDDIDEAARKCVVCTDEIVIGILAAGCGHVVCQR